MRNIFICSPYAPKSKDDKEAIRELQENIERAQKACRYVLESGNVPYAPHLYFTQFLEDEDHEERMVGQILGLKWLKFCDELWVIGREISSGMKKEIRAANRAGIPVRYYVEKRTVEERISDAIHSPEVCFREMD